MNIRKIALLSSTVAVTAGLIAAPANAATVTATDGGKEIDCRVTLSADEMKDLSARAAAYATDRSDFGKTIFPDLAKELGLTEKQIWNFANKEDKAAHAAAKDAVKKAAEEKGWDYGEAKALASFGRERDAQHYIEKYTKKYTEFNVDNDDWDHDYAKVMRYKNAITDRATLLSYLGAEEKPSKPFLAFLSKHEADFKAPLTAAYRLKSVGLVGLSACVSAYEKKAPAEFSFDDTFTAPSTKVLAKFTGNEHHHSHGVFGSVEGYFPVILSVAGVLGVVAAVIGAVTANPAVLPAELRAALHI